MLSGDANRLVSPRGPPHSMSGDPRPFREVGKLAAPKIERNSVDQKEFTYKAPSYQAVETNIMWWRQLSRARIRLTVTQEYKITTMHNKCELIRGVLWVMLWPPNFTSFNASCAYSPVVELRVDSEFRPKDFAHLACANRCAGDPNTIMTSESKIEYENVSACVANPLN